MTERDRALAAFDQEQGIPESVSITAVEIGFWNLVNLILKIYLAWIVASLIIGAVIGVFFAIFLLFPD